MLNKKNNLLVLLLIIANILIATNIYAETDKIVESEVSSSDIRFEKYDSSSNNDVKLLNNSVEQDLYTIVHNGLLNLDDVIDVERFDMTIEQVRDIFFEVTMDNPEIFYTGGFSYNYNSSSGIVTSISPKYTYDKSKISSKLDEVNNKANEIINTVIKPNMTDFEKELAIHNYIVLNTRYDEENYNNGTIPTNSYNVYGTLTKGVAVCQGYSETLKLLLNKVGIECIVVSAPEMNHIWNIVTIDGKRYHVDITWNDPIPDRSGKVRYKYLNLPDYEMKKDHIWNYENYPTCTHDDYSILWDVDSPIKKDNYIYYSSDFTNKEFIYKLDLNTFKKQQITNIRAPYFAIGGDWIYFSNYSNEGYFYKVKLDGTGLTKLNSTHSTNIYVKDNYVYYTVEDLGVVEKLKIDVPSVEDYTGYLEWEAKSNVPLDKEWNIKFNYPINKSTTTKNNVYITDAYGRLFEDVNLSFNQLGDIAIIKPTKNYDDNTTYYLHVENIKSKTGKMLSENIKMKFNTSL